MVSSFAVAAAFDSVGRAGRNGRVHNGAARPSKSGTVSFHCPSSPLALCQSSAVVFPRAEPLFERSLAAVCCVECRRGILILLRVDSRLSTPRPARSDVTLTVLCAGSRACLAKCHRRNVSPSSCSSIAEHRQFEVVSHTNAVAAMAPPTETTSRKLFDDDDKIRVVEEEEETDKDTTTAGRKRRSSSRQTKSSSGILMDRFLTTATSPTKKKSKTAVVTPDKTSAAAAPPPPQQQHKKYVPHYIHKNLEYKRESSSSSQTNKEQHLDSVTRKVYAWIQENCTIPDDFETNRAYGPWSGSCHEERVLRAYRLGLLTTTKTNSNDAVMCTSCATVGHSQNQCPALI